MSDDDRPRAMAVHEIGQSLDTLSLHEFDERLSLLRLEIARLEAARDSKRAAVDAASSIFGQR